ncbi:MAG: hypothetical protein WBM40_11920, partial [Thiohalocapsa sp.]
FGLLFCLLVLPASATWGREQADLPAFASKHLLATMRDHLEALQEVTALVSKRHYEKAADLAEERLGMSSVEIHYEKHVGKYMPKGMRTLGTRMHEAASRFAETARNAAAEGESDKLFGALADVMAQCVACHDSYRTR